MFNRKLISNLLKACGCFVIVWTPITAVSLLLEAIADAKILAEFYEIDSNISGFEAGVVFSTLVSTAGIGLIVYCILGVLYRLNNVAASRRT